VNDHNKNDQADAKELHLSNKNFISIIYHQRNDSPKYFEIKKSKIYWFIIGLPTFTFMAILLGVLGLVNSSPFHLIENYRHNLQVRKEMSAEEDLKEENEKLKIEKKTLEESLKSYSERANSKNPLVTQPSTIISTDLNGKTCPAPLPCPPPPVAGTINSIGLSTLSLFKPIQGQRDRTKPAVLSLSGFKVVNNRDTLNLQFNIIPSNPDDIKIAGHIVVLMKNELGISAYPLQALGSSDFQINYSAGETFATQRFRPVDANFVKPRKSGNFSFTVFIFAKNGDLIHFHTVNLPVQL